MPGVFAGEILTSEAGLIVTEVFPQPGGAIFCFAVFVDGGFAPEVEARASGPLGSATNFCLSAWFAVLIGPTTRSRTAVESLVDIGSGSLDLRSLVWVCAAASVGNTSNNAIKRKFLFIVALNSGVNGARLPGHRLAAAAKRLARKQLQASRFS